MKAHLKHFGLEAEDLLKTEKCAAYLEKLVAMAQKLKLEDVNDTRYHPYQITWNRAVHFTFV